MQQVGHSCPCSAVEDAARSGTIFGTPQAAAGHCGPAKSDLPSTLVDLQGFSRRKPAEIGGPLKTHGVIRQMVCLGVLVPGPTGHELEEMNLQPDEHYRAVQLAVCQRHIWVDFHPAGGVYIWLQCECEQLPLLMVIHTLPLVPIPTSKE